MAHPQEETDPRLYDAAVAEDRVWSAAQVLIEAGALDEDFLRSERLTDAAAAASSVVFAAWRTETAAELLAGRPAEKQAGMASGEPGSVVATAEGAQASPYDRITAAVSTLLYEKSLQADQMTFTDEEVAGFHEEAVFGAVEVRNGLREPMLIREAANDTAGSDFHISTIEYNQTNGNSYRVEYTVSNDTATFRRSLVVRDATGYHEQGTVTTGIVSPDDMEWAINQLEQSHVRAGRIWGTYKAETDEQRAGSTAAESYLSATSELSFTCASALLEASDNPGRTFTAREIAGFNKEGIAWAIDANERRKDITIRSDGTGVTVTKELVLYTKAGRAGRVTSVHREIYVIGAEGAIRTNESFTGKHPERRRDPTDTSQTQMDAAAVRALAKEIQDMDINKVWQRTETEPDA